ncbi:MAG TPA: iron-sulfur cluster assembly scaffold protein [Candidatus Kapabacteria bacterium]|nr:iron-sulfur cluster assembly scaffold protein [Candidatus Kapabacteria bacterium]
MNDMQHKNGNDTSSLYKDMILSLYKHPLNKGVLSSYDVMYKDVSTSCGDEIALYIQFDSDGRIAGITHDGNGCAISQAAVSLLTDEVKGKKMEDIIGISKEHVIGLLGVPISYTREGCATLGWKVLQEAIKQYKRI